MKPEDLIGKIVSPLFRKNIFYMIVSLDKPDHFKLLSVTESCDLANGYKYDGMKASDLIDSLISGIWRIVDGKKK